MPPFTKCPGGNEEKSNNSTSLLLELYPLYIRDTLQLDRMELDVLFPICPPTDELNGVKAPGRHSCGFRNDGSFVNLERQLPRLDSLVPKRWLFSHFADGVLSGIIDCDLISEFANHMAPHMKQMRKWRDEALGDPDLENPDYIPPDDDEAMTPKPKVDPIKKRYAGALRQLFQFGETGMIQTPYAGKISNVHLGAMFAHYQHAGVIRKVVFDSKKLEKVCQNTNNEDLHVGAEQLMDLVTANYNQEKLQKKKQKRALPSSGTPEMPLTSIGKKRRMVGRVLDVDMLVETSEEELSEEQEEETENSSSSDDDDESSVGEDTGTGNGRGIGSK